MELNIAVMVSGNGTNLQSIIDAINKNEIKSKIRLIISNNKDAYGLKRGNDNNINSIYISKKQFKDISDYENNLLNLYKKNKIDLIILAGYLDIISNRIIEKYENKIVNIHPSLIPSFCGKKYYGIKVHEKALEYGVKITGATTHFVNEGIDTGSIIMQEAIPVEEKITAENLQKEVLKIEHKILVETIKLIEDDKVNYNKNTLYN